MAQNQPLIDRLRATAPGGIVSRGVDDGTPAGSSQVTTRGLPAGGMVKMIPASLAIKSLSVTQGEPDDPIMISGTAFGSVAGEVHFVVAPNMDVIQKNFIWNDTQIFTSIPRPTSGVPAFNGALYVKRGDNSVSNMVPFTFIPLTERRIISIPAPPTDSILPRDDYFEIYPDWNLAKGIYRCNCAMFWNPSGEDQFFRTTVLKNGWKVYAPPTLQTQFAYGLGGGAFVLNSPVGTNSPYVDVHWWVDVAFPFCSTYGYSFVMYIEGPQGTSDGVVVP